MWPWKFTAASIAIIVFWPRGHEPRVDTAKSLKASIPNTFENIQFFSDRLNSITSLATRACSEIQQYYGDFYHPDDPIYPIGQSYEWVLGAQPPLVDDESAIVDRGNSSVVDIQALCQKIELFHRRPSPDILRAARNGTLDTYSAPWLQLATSIPPKPSTKGSNVYAGPQELDSRFKFRYERVHDLFTESEWVANGLVGSAMEEFQENLVTLSSIYTNMLNAERIFSLELKSEKSTVKRQEILSRIIEGSVQLGPDERHIERQEEKLAKAVHRLKALQLHDSRISSNMLSWVVGIELINLAVNSQTKGYDSRSSCATVTPVELQRILSYMSLTWFNQGRSFPLHLWGFQFGDVRMDHVNNVGGGYWAPVSGDKVCLYG